VDFFSLVEYKIEAVEKHLLLYFRANMDQRGQKKKIGLAEMRREYRRSIANIPVDTTIRKMAFGSFLPFFLSFFSYSLPSFSPPSLSLRRTRRARAREERAK